MSPDRSRTAPRPAVALPRGTLDGPKRAAVALALFFAASMLAVQLAYSGVAPAARAPAAEPGGAPAPEADLVAAAGPPPSPLFARASAAAADLADGAADPLSLGVAPVPAPAVPAERERAIAACVERTIQASGAGVPKTTAPGRWPALKRAREELRQKRLAARAACEQGATP